MIHDAQCTAEEYGEHIGGGHSSTEQAVAFAEIAEVAILVTFHHDPWRKDEERNASVTRIREQPQPHLQVLYGREGDALDLQSAKHGPAG